LPPPIARGVGTLRHRGFPGAPGFCGAGDSALYGCSKTLIPTW
jgi:hypothetical protein